MIYFKRILWLISWSLQDDQGVSHVWTWAYQDLNKSLRQKFFSSHFKNILHSFQGDFKILVKVIYFKRILWLISWSLQDDQGVSHVWTWAYQDLNKSLRQKFFSSHLAQMVTASANPELRHDQSFTRLGYVTGYWLGI